MSDKNAVLATYRDIIEVIKTGLITDINLAISQGTLTIDDNTRTSLLSLVDTIIASYAANGYEQLTRVLDTKPPKKKR
jgi:hypothetical protein